MQRWSTVAANDGQGGFLYDFARAAKDGFPAQLIGVPYNKTNQVLKYASSNTGGYQYETDLIGLDIKDYWIGMLGAVEVVASTEAEHRVPERPDLLACQDRRQRRPEAPRPGRGRQRPALQRLIDNPTGPRRECRGPLPLTPPSATE